MADKKSRDKGVWLVTDGASLIVETSELKAYRKATELKTTPQFVEYGQTFDLMTKRAEITQPASVTY